jgi:hypothetical protein
MPRLTDANPESIIVLEEGSDSRDRNAIKLEKQGIDIRTPNFFVGHMRADSGESIYHRSRKEAAELVFDIADEAIAQSPLLTDINDYYQRDTVKLHYAKRVAFPIEELIMRIYAAQEIAGDREYELWLEMPNFPTEIIREHYQFVDIVFYGKSRTRIPDVKRLALEAGRFLRDTILSVFRKFSPRVVDRKHTVLMVQEGEIGMDSRLRSQSHWLGCLSRTERPQICIAGVNPVPLNKKYLEEKGITILENRLPIPASMTPRQIEVMEKVSDYCNRVFWASVTETNNQLRHTYKIVHNLLAESRRMAAAAIHSGCDVFLFSDPYMVSTDAFQLVAPALGVRTVSYQYSNLGFVHPVMLSTSDVMLIFSERFEELYAEMSIHPISFEHIGYPYDDVPKRVAQYSREHRQQLESMGAEFIICYFDESVQENRWGLISEEDHLEDLHMLFDLILNDPQMGIILKSQFVRNSATKKYHDDLLLKQAFQTGRILELESGTHRNRIFPAEAALASDIAIGHKFGATASLESAVAGIRSLLINRSGFISAHDELYAECEIEFKSLREALDAIMKYRSGEKKYRKLGDWAEIIDQFVSYCDGGCAERILSKVCSPVNQC